MAVVLIEEGPHPQIFSLVKFISEEWVEEFRRGRIRMGSVASFRRDDAHDDGGRQDVLENLASMFQPERIVMKIDDIEVEGLAGPVEIRHGTDEMTYLLCMTVVTDRSLNAGQGSLLLDSRLARLGDKAVIVRDVKEFKRRIQNDLSRRGYFAHHRGQERCDGIVDYVDMTVHHGHFGPFRKSNAFAFQSEWRLAILDTRGLHEDAIFLEIGDISDITTVMDSTVLVGTPIVVEPNPGAKPIDADECAIPSRS
ncbi:hypothetical protein J2Y55_004566 [Bosea sp. BE125]|uniref:hypothetical protein n=1 Tax=Bosea sp. BE125 TaxID=2817909 RepID=UPI002857EA89|nr:hypothetical protein [Bosea sp. BE125]MDR6873539.1 hypothetical protein [Bosea sp. BE125]